MVMKQKDKNHEQMTDWYACIVNLKPIISPKRFLALNIP